MLRNGLEWSIGADQYWRLLKPSLKTTSGFRTFRGPSVPGAPAPPRTQVETHFRAHLSDSADFGFMRLRGASSPARGTESAL